LGAALVISDFSRIAVMAAKESVNRAFEERPVGRRDVRAPPVPRAVRHGDQKEGMDAFVNKRKACSRIFDRAFADFTQKSVL
jgi:enoyl-CoA hydratase